MRMKNIIRGRTPQYSDCDCHSSSSVSPNARPITLPLVRPSCSLCSTASCGNRISSEDQLLPWRAVLVHQFPQIKAFDTDVYRLEDNEQVMGWVPVFKTLRKCLPHGLFLVCYRPAVDESGLMNSHELLQCMNCNVSLPIIVC